MLERIETVADADGAVRLHFANGAKLDLAPGEQSVEAFGGTFDFKPHGDFDFVLELREPDASTRDRIG